MLKKCTDWYADGALQVLNVARGMHIAIGTKLPSGNWRAQVRKVGLWVAKMFALKRDVISRATRVAAQIIQGYSELITPNGSFDWPIVTSVVYRLWAHPGPDTSAPGS